jgi:hypothetical protein
LGVGSLRVLYETNYRQWKKDKKHARTWHEAGFYETLAARTTRR